MTTQYTPILKLALPVQGELSGTWGDTVNDNITSMVEEAIAGRSVINSWTANSHTLTTADGTTAESRAMMLEFTDTGVALTGAGTVICPAASKVYVCKNSSGQVITVKTSGGTGVAVPNGATTFVFCDGTNVEECVTNIVDVTVSGTITLASGVSVSAILDEDNMASDSATALATQQSIKAYVDSQVTAQDLDIAGDTGTGAVDLDSQSLTIAGTANEIETSASGQTVTVGLPTAIIVTTITTTNVQATNVKANDGTTAITIADTTGQVTVADAVLTTADINGGTADDVTIGATTPAAGSFTTLGASGTTSLGGALALTGNLDINTNKFNVTAADGNTTIAGTLGVTGNVDLNGGTIDGTVIGGSSAAAGSFTTISASGEIAANGGVAFGDNDVATFGAGDDLQIYHDGTHSYIQDTGAGNLFFLTQGAEISLLGNTSAEYMGRFIQDGAVELYHNGASKLSTTATGIDVTGTVTADGLTVTSGAASGTLATLKGNTGFGFTLASSGVSPYVQEIGVGGGEEIALTSGGVTLARFQDGGDISFYEDTGATTKFFWDASAESLGIGTSSPTTKLNISSNVGTTGDFAGSVRVKNESFTAGTYAGVLFDTADTANSYVTSIRNASYAGTLAFGTNSGANATSLVERMRIDSSGNVGIGTTSPTTNLDGLKGLSIDGGTTGGGVAVGSSTHAYLMYTNAAVSDGLVFWDSTNNAERARIDSSGNLLVGTTSADGASGATIKPDGSIRSIFGSGEGGQCLLAAIAGVSNGFVVEADTSNNITYKFNTSAGEKMRLDNSGNLLVGTTSSTAPHTLTSGSGGAMWNNSLYISIARTSDSLFLNRIGSDGGVARFYRDGGTDVGSISVTASTTAYNITSDYRLKENVVSMDNASDRVLALNPVRFNFIADPEKTVDGFLAHEAQEVVPEAVHGVKDEVDDEGNPVYQGIDQSKLVPLLTKALQEALQRIEALEAKLA